MCLVFCHPNTLKSMSLVFVLDACMSLKQENSEQAFLDAS